MFEGKWNFVEAPKDMEWFTLYDFLPISLPFHEPLSDSPDNNIPEIQKESPHSPS